MFNEPSACESLWVLAAQDGAHGSSSVLINAIAVCVLEGHADRVIVRLLFRENVFLAHVS